MEVQALSGYGTMRFMYLGVTVTAQEPAVAQEQEERLQTQKRLQRQGNLYRARERIFFLFQQRGLMF